MRGGAFARVGRAARPRLAVGLVERPGQMAGPPERAIRPASGTERSSRWALSGAGDPCDQHGSRERPIPGAVALETGARIGQRERLAAGIARATSPGGARPSPREGALQRIKPLSRQDISPP